MDRHCIYIVVLYCLIAGVKLLDPFERYIWYPLPRGPSRRQLSAEIWIAMNGDVYDVTKFHRIHPGGSQIILQHAGKARLGGLEHIMLAQLRRVSLADFEMVILMDLSGGTLKPFNLMERFTVVTHENTCQMVLDCARIYPKHPNTFKMKHPDCGVAVPSQLGDPTILRTARMPPLCLPLWVIRRKPRRWVGGCWDGGC